MIDVSFFIQEDIRKQFKTILFYSNLNTFIFNFLFDMTSLLCIFKLYKSLRTLYDLLKLFFRNQPNNLSLQLQFKLETHIGHMSIDTLLVLKAVSSFQ